MINITDKTTCSGCTACATICPQSAITMQPDALGFKYPIVSFDKCINCGLCDRVCSFKPPIERTPKNPLTYLMRHKDVSEVLKSKSGGAFVVLSDVILSEGGIVYGARLNQDHLVEHAAATTVSARNEFRGSKYIQSDLDGIFAKVRADLKANKKVLFTGTPCQVAGLKSFIDQELAENLFLVDLLCHGVASPAIWKDYIEQIEHRKGKRIRRCIPRNPKYGWYNSVDTFIFNDDTQYNSDYFTGYVYHKWIIQRWSCSACPFTSLNRVSDVTIGDAWGHDRVAPDFDTEGLGCSIVLANTHKGEQLVKAGLGNAKSMPIEIDNMMQPVLKHPTSFHSKRQRFEDMYIRRGFKYAKLIYLNDTLSSAKASIFHTLIKIKHTIFK